MHLSIVTSISDKQFIPILPIIIADGNDSAVKSIAIGNTAG